MKLIMNIKNRYYLSIALIALACCNISLNAAQRSRGTVLTAPQKATKRARLNALISIPASSQPNIAAGNELASLASELNLAGAIDKNLYDAAIKKANQLKQGNIADRQALQSNQQALIDLQNQLDQSRLDVQQAQQEAFNAQQALAAAQMQKPIKGAAPMPGGGDAAALAVLQQELAQRQQQLQQQEITSARLRQELAQAEQALADAKRQPMAPSSPMGGIPSQVDLLKLQQQLEAQSDAMTALMRERDNLAAQLRRGDKGQDQRIVNLETQLQRRLDEKNDALELFKGVQKRNEECREELKGLEEEIEALKEQIKRQEQRQSARNLSRQEKGAISSEALKNATDALKQELDIMKNRYEQAQQQARVEASAQNVEIERLHEQLAQQQSRGAGNEGAAETIKALQKQINELNTQLRVKDTAAQQVLAETEARYQIKQEALQQQLAQRPGEGKEGAANNEEILELQRKNRELQTRLNQETEGFREQLAAAKKENLEMRNQHIEMQEAAAAQIKKVTEQQERVIAELQNKLTACAKQPKSKEQQQREALQRDLLKAEERARIAEGRIRDQDIEGGAFRDATHRIQMDLAEEKEKNKQLNDENTRLKNELEKINRMLD